MALSNPTINAPRLSAAAARRSFHGRSPSHSPVRIDPRDHDPLLRDLSPTATLRTFSIDTHGNDESNILGGLGTASAAERALGTKAAKACLQLRSWARELQSWEWTGDFSPPTKEREQIRTVEGKAAATQIDQWVCLPADVVSAHWQRLDEINRELDDIDVEELKDYALSVYHPVGGMRNQNNEMSRGSTQPLSRLEDITALITATILQALPYLSQVIVLLNSWNIRLSICTRAPVYLQDLAQAKHRLRECWQALGTPEDAKGGHDFDQQTMREMQNAIEMQISSLGKRLDRFLDELEGRDETVPDFWIDDLEDLEQKYGEWTVRAERVVLQNGWRKSKLSFAEQRATAPSGLVTETTGNSAVSAETVPFAPLPVATSSRDVQDATTDAAENVRPPSRHVPIVIDMYGDGQSYEKSLAGDSVLERAESPWSRQNRSSPLENDFPRTNVAKIRSAFINSEIEKSESLQKQSKSPVRPFEHASTAFTRLFKRDKEKAPDLARSSSSLSNRSNRSGTSSFRADQAYSPSPSPVPNPRTASLTSQSRQTPISNRSIPGPATPAHRSPSPGSPLSLVTPDSLGRLSKRSSREVEYVVPKSSGPETYRPTGAAPKSPVTYQPTRASPSKDFPENWPLAQSSDEEAARIPASPLQGIREMASEEFHDSPVPPSTYQIQDDFTLNPDGVDSPIYSGARSPSVGVSPHRAIQRPRSALALLTQPEIVDMNDQNEDAESFIPTNIRRASYASIESHPRSAVRSVTLSRRTSMTGKTPPLSPSESRSASAVRPGADGRDQILDFPSPPNVTSDPFSHAVRTLANETEDRLTLMPSDDELVAENTESPVLGRGGTIPQLEGHAMKVRHVVHERPVSSKRNKPEPEPDAFDRHVNEVLQTLHSNIKFRTRPGAETPVLPSRARTPEPRGLINGKTRSNRASSGAGRAVTIAPAEASPKKTSVAAEPVKLYHLRQEGRDEPIKLFVRLVGEGERVMVRVGGGWADLADYLRQYAEHHGSRTTSASGNDLEMLTSDPVAAAHNANGLRKVSDPIDTSKGRRSSTPDTLGKRQKQQDWLEDPQPRFTMGDSDEDGPETSDPSAVSGTAMTTSPTVVAPHGTPRSTSSTKDPHPPTSDQNTPTHTNTLAGPASAKRAAGLPDHKARWVEGMIEKAKASAEKDKNERDKYFTEMGKVGGTKRVVFNRSSSGTGPASR